MEKTARLLWWDMTRDKKVDFVITMRRLDEMRAKGEAFAISALSWELEKLARVWLKSK